ncbi:MAG: AAA family ATPase, partial [Flavobacteriaceae bacterium]|nr:AAA family ATPase [Flavobacteriaceae bacterium]
MLRHILIKNFALIELLELDLFPEYTVITGETGAGKSIILGALDLVLGKRAQPKLIKNPDEKCVIEAHFDLSKYHLKPLFESQEVDYAELSIFRRELLPSGKSRAFINDMPVALQQMETLSASLIDIHAQHDTLNIQQSDTVFSLIDGFADNLGTIKDYQGLWLSFNENKKRLKKLTDESQHRKDEINYLQFQYDEIQQLAPKPHELESLEIEVKKQENAEQILQILHQVYFSLSESETNHLDQLRQSVQELNSIQKFDEKIAEVNQRLQSL